MVWVAKFQKPASPSTLRQLGVVAFLLCASGITACTHPCLALADKQCECSDGDLQQQQCQTEMQASFDLARQSDLDNNKQVCSDLLDTCDCTKLDTEAGRAACGLTR